MKKIICAIFAFLVFFVPCYAIEQEGYEERYASWGMDDVIDSVPDDAKDIAFSENLALNDGLYIIWDKMRESAGEILGSGLRCVMTIVAISMLCSCVGSFYNFGDNSAVKTSLSLVGALAVTAAASGSLTSMIGIGKSFISDIDAFSKSLLPTLAAAEAASGMPGSAVVRASAAVFFSDILITVIRYALLPLTYLNIFSATANAAAENAALRKISDLSGKIVSVVLKFILSAYVSYISVAGIVSGGADKAGVKTAKFAVGTAVPVVGGVISEVTETVITGAMLMKNTIGVFGVLVVLMVCITPFLTLGINYVLFKFAAVCASPVIDGSIGELTERLSKSFGLMLAMCASCATVILIAIISAMRSVGVM